MNRSRKFMTFGNIVALILAIIGLIWLIHGLWRNWKINRISRWPKTDAVVLNSVAEPANREAGDTYIDPSAIVAKTDDEARYIPIIVYRYRIGNKDYQSSNVVYSGDKSYNSLDIKTIMGQITQGSTISVYYNPNSPSESYIYNGSSSYTGIVIGILLLLAAIYLVYHNYEKGKETEFTIKVDRTSNNMASPTLTDYDTVSRSTRIPPVSSTARRSGTISISKTARLNNRFY